MNTLLVVALALVGVRFCAADWKINENSPFSSPEEFERSLMHISESEEEARKFAAPQKLRLHDDVPLPKHFMAHEKWPQCEWLIKDVIDQAGCGSCWAVSSVAAFADRLCIATNGTIQKQFSAWDILECCEDCGVEDLVCPVGRNCSQNWQCGGGYPGKAFKYIMEHGVVTGSNFRRHDGCKPYPLAACTVHFAEDTGRAWRSCPSVPMKDYQCNTHCQADYQDSTYGQDKYFTGGKYPYDFFNQSQVEQAMRNLMEHGPLLVDMYAYSDLSSYGSGVYEHKWGDRPGGHILKVIGWSEDENGTPYWLIVNSWSGWWGEKGMLRIKRGVNEANVEKKMFGVIVNPSVYNLHQKINNKVSPRQIMEYADRLYK